jgi:hypothetical protein
MIGALAALPTMVLVLMMVLSAPTPAASASATLANAGTHAAPSVPTRAIAVDEARATTTRHAPARARQPMVAPPARPANLPEDDEAEIEPVEPPSKDAPGTLVVVVLGGKCALAVDGASHGVRASLSLKVPSGSHSVTCAPEGKGARARRVTVQPGKKAVTMFKL